MKKILVVENERIVAQDLSQILTDLGHDVIGVATNFDDARALCSEHQPDLALLDINIDGSRDGIALAIELREDFSMAIAFITSRSDHKTIDQASATRPNGYLVKPFKRETVDALVTVALGNFSDANQSVNFEALSGTRIGTGQGLTDDVKAQVVSFIENNIDKTIKVEALADIANLNPQIFAKRFQESFDASPYQYLISARIDEGKRLLRNTDWRLAEIALSIGFSSQAHFTTSFKKAVGVTPSSYRNSSK